MHFRYNDATRGKVAAARAKPCRRPITLANSEPTSAAGQATKEAIDGIIGGYPKVDADEWSSVNGKAGTTLTLKWTRSYTLDRVVLWDRPNTDHQITAGN